MGKMRELIYKCFSNPISHKRDISIKEIVKKGGIVSTTQKRSIYFIIGVHHVKTQSQLEDWLNQRKNDPVLKKRFFHILRCHSDQTESDKLVCKMRGGFCAVVGRDIYNIIYIHKIKMETFREKKEKT